MKIINFLKQPALLVLVLAVASGCAGGKSKETQHASKSDTAPGDVAGKSSGGNQFSSYTVVSGDSLWNIAGSRSIYGDPYKWPLIYKANKSRISDADLIYSGQIFDIDQLPSSGTVSAAVNHAKTRGAWSVSAVEASDTRYLVQ